MADITFAIQAHPVRAAWAESLAAELGAPIAWAQEPFAVPGDRRAVWRTKRAALLLAGDAPWHCVVQDDAILAPRFIERVHDLVTRGEFLYMLFFRQKRLYRDVNRVAIKSVAAGGFTYHEGPILGPGLIFPTARIPSLIAAGDADPGMYGDDDRVKRWQRATDLDVYVPLPSLVDHRAGPSLVGHDIPKRRAWRMAS